MTEISAKSPPEELSTKLPNVCRVCLALEGDFYEIADVYLEETDDSTNMLALSAVLSLFIDDELKGGDLMPTTICKSCADKAQAAYKFIDQCRQTDEWLEDIFKDHTGVGEPSPTVKDKEDKDVSSFPVPDTEPEEQNDIDKETIMTVKDHTDDKEPMQTVKDKEDEDVSSFPVSDTEPEEQNDIDKKSSPKKKRYSCPKCEKSFLRKPSLKRHVASHDPKNWIQCQHCDKAFMSSMDLTRHMRIHTGERPYRCQLCPKAYIDPWALNKHVRSHWHDQVYKCTICSRVLATRGGFYYHRKKHMQTEQAMRHA